MALAARRPFQPPDRRQLPTQHGVVICVVPGDHTIPIEIERAPDSGGSPGTYAQVHVGTFAKSGGFFTDYLPNDNATRWYRVRHGKGEIYGNASAYLTAFSAVPRQLREDPFASQSVAVAPFSRNADLGTDAVATVNVQAEAITPTESQSRFRAKVTKSGTQDLTTLVVDNVSWDQETADVGTMHDNSTNNHRLTIPSGGNTGFWIVHARTIIEANGSTLTSHQVGIAASTGGYLSFETQTAYVGGFAVFDQIAFVSAPAAGTYYYVEISPIFSGGPARVTTGSFFEAIHVW